MNNIKPVVSVVTPVYDEQESLPKFFDRVTAVMKSIGLPYEIIVVNDGSKDASAEIIKNRCHIDEAVKTVEFSRNFGQQAAFLCGLKKCSGDCALLIDADLQDPPELFPQMIAKWREGYEVVHGVRRVREGETAFKKQSSKLFMKILSSSSGIKLPDNSGEFKLYDRKVIDAVIALPERSRYLRIQTAFVGFREAFVEFDRAERTEGKTKFTLKKMLKTAEAGIIPYTNLPLKLPLVLGVLLGAASIIAFLIMAIIAAVGGYLPLAAWLFPTIGLSTSLVLTTLGIIGVYVGYTYDEAKHRPVYVEREQINFGEKANGDDR